jgi:hypothetical protein
MLVSEPAACPFCVQPEFGVTFDPPPFRRGLAYGHNGQGPSLGAVASAMSSSSSLNSGTNLTPSSGGAGRRRTTSLSASAPQVITTDRVRPDWAKKLADARAHALRRSAAATALHNAAYMMGNYNNGDGRGFGLGRRRRMFSGDSPNDSGQHTPPVNPSGSTSRLGDGQGDLPPGRHSSRRHRVDDLEELMMMEAIRLSLAAEEDRKRKEDKEAAKEAKKEEKRKAKELKKVAKEQSKIARGFHPVAIPNSPDDPSSAQLPANGKGKGVDRNAGVGFNPLQEPTSTLNQGGPSSEAPQADQAASSSASSTSDSAAGSLHHDQNNNNPAGLNVPSSSAEGEAQSSSFHSETPPQSSNLDSLFNFRSLAAIIDNDDKSEHESSANHIENVGPAPAATSPAEPAEPAEATEDPMAASSSSAAETSLEEATATNMEESTLTVKAPETEAEAKVPTDPKDGNGNVDTKQPGDIRVLDTGQSTQ